MERIRTTPGAVVEMLCRKVREDNFLFPQIFEKIWGFLRVEDDVGAAAHALGPN